MDIFEESLLCDTDDNYTAGRQDFVPDFMVGLNPEQEEAVKTTEGALLVLSGAGTGKTRVLTTRIAYIIHQQLAQPWQILAVTFTNKASKEMKERLSKMIGEPAYNVWLGTFHAIGIRILRKYGEKVGVSSNFIVIDSDDQERLVKQIMQDAGIDTKKYPPKAMLEVIQRWKDKGLLPSTVSPLQNSGFCEGRALGFYTQYQQRLQALNAVDFGDLLLLPLALFQANPDILALYQHQFKYILVDEYQDTNVAQYMLLRLLAKQYGNICCVGDDDQSIYSWRGAEVENILSFKTVFPDAKTIKLERNYRSTAHILGAASSLIAHNKGRLGKTLKVADTSGDKGDKIAILGCYNGNQEAENVIQHLEMAHKNGTPYAQMAILVRASFQTRLFEEALMKAFIPYKIIGGFKFYEREEIKDAVAYLRLLLNPSDDLAFMRIVNKPKRGIGKQSIDTIYKTAQEKNISLHDAIAWAPLRPAVRKTLDSLLNLFKKYREKITTLPLVDLARFIINESGYIEMWQQDKSPEAQGRVENIMELYGVLEDFDNLQEFIEYATLVSEAEDNADDDKVVVMTLHASKGLEFHHIYLPGWEEGVFPNQKALDEKGDIALEEERRLAYVGITRARKKAFIFFANNRKMYGQWLNSLPSRFIDELDTSHIHHLGDSRQKSHHDFDSLRPQWGNHNHKKSNTYDVDNDFNHDTSDYPLKSKWDRETLNEPYSRPATTAQTFTDKSNPHKKIGKKVHHPTFGTGIIIKEEGTNLTVRFNSGALKKIMAKFLNVVE